MNKINLEDKPADIEQLLKTKGWLNDESVLSLEKPGEGNMNVVLRVITDSQSFILKQSRPYVQKYQQIPAPLERIETEYQFYKLVSMQNAKINLPEILSYDPTDHMLMMADIGQCDDMTSIYGARNISQSQISILIELLGSIHQTENISNFPKNIALRELNHQHIFHLPFITDNGFNLNDVQNGLQEISLKFKSDITLRQRIKDLGDLYLSDKGNHLIHGDYYPGSWMQIENDVYVLDPEFSFVGFREFDLGVMSAHIIMATNAESAIENIIEIYGDAIDGALLRGFAGTEIMRRIIGLAQLPLTRALEEKEILLDLAKSLINN